MSFNAEIGYQVIQSYSRYTPLSADTGISLNLAHRTVTTLAILSAVSLSFAQLEGSKPDTQPVQHPIPAIQDRKSVV